MRFDLFLRIFFLAAASVGFLNVFSGMGAEHRHSEECVHCIVSGLSRRRSDDSVAGVIKVARVTELAEVAAINSEIESPPPDVADVSFTPALFVAGSSAIASRAPPRIEFFRSRTQHQAPARAPPVLA